MALTNGPSFVHDRVSNHEKSAPLFKLFCDALCFQVGLLDEEKILPLGAEITAVGVLEIAPDGTPVVKSSNRLPVFLYVLLN